ncbi:6-bladed beta-propeller [Rhodohalobacter sp.]|uniref:6-bladed beta-propeller n=1 Tax=Rhodohalobacter sp. TaxID=1974210 RepID=UPI002ACD9A41|nr:6-bladed beta-propeller [Rhodohalobacter sp.]MDZ7757394.1 6-bladed beta-propeller [Rhodohalobacter sp.]
MRVFIFNSFSLVLLIKIGCNEHGKQTSDYHNRTVEVKELFSITSDQNDIPEQKLTFSELGRTVVSDDGIIYSVDPWQSIIYKFDNQGNLLNTLGGEGRGPGEFQSIYGMAILDDGKLFAYDYMLARAITFQSNGEIGETITMDFSSSTKWFRMLSSNSILMPMLKNDYIIHEFDIDQQEITESLIHEADVFETDQKFSSLLSSMMEGSAIALNDNLVAYTPEVYEGEIFIYERMDNEWQMREKLSGYQNIEKSYSIHETTSETHNKASYSSIHPEGQGLIGIEIHSRSRGLYLLNNGRFAHTYWRDADDEKTSLNFVVEIFDFQKGRLEKFGVIEELNTGFPPDNDIVWVDKEGYLYVTESNNQPALKKLLVVLGMSIEEVIITIQWLRADQLWQRSRI